MQQAQKSEGSARPVSRTMTSVGGFAVDLTNLPAKPSGRTGADGEVLAPELSDAEAEAMRLVFEMQHSLVSISEELAAGRHHVVNERLLALMQRAADTRSYVEHLARVSAVPHCCPRCKVSITHDPQGQAMCDLCVEMTYGRAIVR